MGRTNTPRRSDPVFERLRLDVHVPVALIKKYRVHPEWRGEHSRNPVSRALREQLRGLGYTVGAVWMATGYVTVHLDGYESVTVRVPPTVDRWLDEGLYGAGFPPELRFRVVLPLRKIGRYRP